MSQVNAPSATVVGGVLQLSWVVKNRGQGPAKGTWSDAVYLSADGLFDPATDLLLGTVNQTRTLAAGASYTGNLSVVTPLIADGTYRVFVLTRRGGPGDPRREPHQQPRSVGRSAGRAHRPAGDGTDGPGTALSGRSVDVSWTVTNTGNAATAGSVWYDHVYLSLDTQLDVLDAPLGQFQHTGALAATSSYTRTLPITLPDGISGTFYLLVQADGGLGIPEGAAEGNNLAARSIQVSLAPYPDLVVTNVEAPTVGPDR